MPFRPTLKTWDEMTVQDIDTKLAKSEADIAAGRVYSQAELDTRMRARFAHGTEPEV